ncbi:MAG: AEC family transporter [Thermoleophilia bacterium]|nr:AEC family transporter [Thermoleophilia bacterium]
MYVLALFAACFALGARRQLRDPAGAARLRSRVWGANVAILIPIAIIYAATTIRVDAALAAAFACGVAAWWLTVGVSLAYARIVEPGDRRARGAIAMSAAFPNTIFLGFPLAHLAYGTPGLQVAVVYDVIGPIVPAVVLSTAIAQSHAGTAVADRATARDVLLGILRSPPTIAMLVGVLVRVAVLDQPLELEVVGGLIGPVAGATGFVAAGLSIPLQQLAHVGREVAQVGGAIVVRMVVAPALLALTGLATGVSIPHVLLLVSAMPTAIHALVIAREHDLQTEVVRLAILASTAIAIVVVPLFTLVR